MDAAAKTRVDLSCRRCRGCRDRDDYSDGGRDEFSSARRFSRRVRSFTIARRHAAKIDTTALGNLHFPGSHATRSARRCDASERYALILNPDAMVTGPGKCVPCYISADSGRD